jgi:hypothetical protein
MPQAVATTEAVAETTAEPTLAEQFDFDPKEVIADAKAFLEMCNAAFGTNREAELDDLRFLSGDHWPANVRRERELDGRPCLTVNKLPTFLHQVTNDQRQNVPGIKVSPVGNGADVKGAEIRQGIIRHIEYSSNADVCYDTAVNSAAAIGEGYFRLITDYCRPDSFDQDIKFKRIRNPFTVYPDPLSVEPDGSDQKRCMLSSKTLKADFDRANPGKESTSQGFQLGTGDATNKDWIGQDFVREAEFYRIEEKPAVLVELTNGETGFEEDLLALPPGVTIKRRRQSSRPRTMLYKLTAIDVLEATEILCPWIPVFPVYGDEIDLDGKVIRSGLIRNAKDPSKMYDFWMTSATEEVALRPKTPYIGAEGQFEGYEDEWNQANVRSFPFMEYKPVTLDGQLAPPPARQPMADIPSGMLTMAMHANDNIKATTGLFDSSLGARGNATSGIQERAQQRQGDVANFHYTDNLNRTVKHVGRCLLAMIPNYIDAPRAVQMMGEDGKITSVDVNQPAPPVPADINAAPPAPGTIGAMGVASGESSLGLSVAKTLNDMKAGDYAATVRAGPSYDTLRQEAATSMVEWGKAWPKLMDIAGDKMIRAQDWPGADEIADRVEKTIPAELRDDDDEGDAPAMVQTPKGPIPLEQAAQMLQEMDQQIQQMGAELKDATAGIEKTRIEAGSRERVAEINAVSKSDVAELQGLIKLLVAKLPPPPALVADALTQGDGATSAASPQELRPVGSAPMEAGANAQPPTGSIAGQEIAP